MKSEIWLNNLQKSAIKLAIKEGKKCVIMSDLMINIYGQVFEVTNAHTGKVMKVMNWTK